jgi:hypothetical protein
MRVQRWGSQNPIPRHYVIHSTFRTVQHRYVIVRDQTSTKRYYTNSTKPPPDRLHTKDSTTTMWHASKHYRHASVDYLTIPERHANGTIPHLDRNLPPLPYLTNIRYHAVPVPASYLGYPLHISWSHVLATGHEFPRGKPDYTLPAFSRAILVRISRRLSHAFIISSIRLDFCSCPHEIFQAGTVLSPR